MFTHTQDREYAGHRDFASEWIPGELLPVALVSPDGQMFVN